MMMRLSSILLILHSLCVTINVAQDVSLAKPGCPKKCGNITIPYPFGIGANCSAGTNFTVECRTNFSSPKLFLSVLNLEAQTFSLSQQTVRVVHAVSALHCSMVQKRVQLVELQYPYTVSNINNSFVIIGCKNRIFSPYGACNPYCSPKSMERGCDGINCCQARIPPRLTEFDFEYSSIEENNVGNTCGYAFITDRGWLRRYNNTNFQNFVNGFVPVVLEWDFNLSEVRNYSGVTCRPSYDSESNISCSCDFEGNPFLPGGCRGPDVVTGQREGAGPEYGTSICAYICVGGRTRTTIIGVSSGIGALLLLTWAWMSTKVIRKRIKANRKRKFFKNCGLFLQKQLSSNDGGVEKIKLFNSKELALATDNYNVNRILGHGGQGTVYKGMLTDGRIVAVKKSKEVNEADVEVFINEVVILSQINHRNIVRLLGFCLETEVPLLVYEFIPNGTLFKHIHDQDDKFPLSWKMRVRIAKEVAGALSYLHYEAQVPIYHRDIKSANILLDDKYRAKVSDFGTSRSIAIDQTHLTTKVMGTFGYVDPEYFQSSQFTDKSDVYSFGVVLVELLTGEKAISTVRDQGERGLAKHFLHSMEANNLFDIIDPEVLKEGPKEEINAIANLARRCLNLNGKMRPTIKEVAAELERIQMSKESSVSPSNLEFQSIAIWEDYDAPSTSESFNLNVVTVESSKSPLLFGDS